ncbi:hypothetical protein, partial [Nocardioides zeae]
MIGAFGPRPGHAASSDEDESTVEARQQHFLATVDRSQEIRHQAAAAAGASASGPSQAQIMAARQAYVDSSICLPTAIAGLALGNICAGRIACNETDLGGYLQNPYLATGAGRPTD